MVRRRDPEVVQVWRERLEQQRREGVRVSEFCQREKISQAAFYRWRKRILGADPRQTPKPRFVPVKVSDSSVTGQRIEIELPSGAVVKLPVESTPELVAAAVTAAGGERLRETVSC